VAAINAAELANRWGTPIYNGYLVLADQQPMATDPPEVVPPPGPQPGGLAWRNAAYAVQWWIFAGFTLVLWWKIIRQEAKKGLSHE
jgi:surfeit locus 1 family protein